MSEDVEDKEEVLSVLADNHTDYLRKQPRVIALLFCNYTNVTGDGKPNLIDVFDRMWVEPKLGKTRNFILFIKLAMVSGTCEILIFNPRNERTSVVLLDSFIPPEAQEEIFFSQTVISLSLEIQVEGIYWFDVRYNGKSIGGNGLQIIFNRGEDLDGSSD